MSATEQDSEIQCAEGPEDERRQETVPEILNSPSSPVTVSLAICKFIVPLYKILCRNEQM